MLMRYPCSMQVLALGKHCIEENKGRGTKGLKISDWEQEYEGGSFRGHCQRAGTSAQVLESSAR